MATFAAYKKPKKVEEDMFTQSEFLILVGKSVWHKKIEEWIKFSWQQSVVNTSGISKPHENKLKTCTLKKNRSLTFQDFFTLLFF